MEGRLAVSGIPPEPVKPKGCRVRKAGLSGGEGI
jgi:hypothetical protein